MPGESPSGTGPAGGVSGRGGFQPFQLKKVIVAAPPLASAATISDPTTSEDVQAGLRREAAVERNPVTTTDPGPGPAPAANKFRGRHQLQNNSRVVLATHQAQP